MDTRLPKNWQEATISDVCYPVSNTFDFKQYKKFIHCDLYTIQETEEYTYLGIEKYLNDVNILCFEWGDKIGDLYESIKKKAGVVYVKMEYMNESVKERKIIIREVES